MSRIFFKPLFGTLCEICFLLQREQRRTYVLLRGLNRVTWPPCFSMSWAVSQDGVCMSVCGSVERRSLVGVHNSIALDPNKHCAVEPCGSTDSFYRSYKGTCGKLGTCLHQSGKTWLGISGFKLFSVCLSWVLFVFSKTSTCRRAKTTLELSAPLKTGNFAVVFFTTKSLKRYYK